MLLSEGALIPFQPVIPGTLLPKSRVQSGGFRVFSALVVLNYINFQCLTTNRGFSRWGIGVMERKMLKYKSLG